jgi:hypothetical protein
MTAGLLDDVQSEKQQYWFYTQIGKRVSHRSSIDSSSINTWEGNRWLRGVRVALRISFKITTHHLAHCAKKYLDCIA